MNYVIFDLEASGASTSFDSVLEIYAKLVDDEFNELDETNELNEINDIPLPYRNAREHHVAVYAAIRNAFLESLREFAPKCMQDMDVEDICAAYIDTQKRVCIVYNNNNNNNNIY